MKHYGDIAQINGAEIEPVDIIVGGSPCQDLSVAGKRAGLEGARSGLFMDQTRIVKEMRNATRRETSDRSTELPRPRYMVWENVPGAFSSNKGEDFRAVLEEICQVCDPEASIPRPAKNKWLSSGTILGDGYSVAWRVVDAQHWGVPSVVVASTLSQILEATPHPKYALSERACQGILRRAERRGKELPEMLKEALEAQANHTA